MEKKQIIDEIQRVANELQTPSLSQRQFSEHSPISLSTVRYTFGTWKDAVEAAGLNISTHKTESLPDEVYL